MTIEKFKKEILIGLSPDNQAVALTLEIGDNYNREENQHFSICGSEYNMSDVFDEDQGEERAREYLEDGEGWRAQVEAGNTTDSMEDFNQEVIDIDGWETILGDVIEIDGYHYVMMGSGGQINMGLNKNPKEWKKLLISATEFNNILHAWKKLHLVHIMGMNEQQQKQMQKVKEIFTKYPGFSTQDLAQFIEKEEIEE